MNGYIKPNGVKYLGIIWGSLQCFTCFIIVFEVSWVNAKQKKKKCIKRKSCFLFQSLKLHRKKVKPKKIHLCFCPPHYHLPVSLSLTVSPSFAFQFILFAVHLFPLNTFFRSLYLLFLVARLGIHFFWALRKQFLKFFSAYPCFSKYLNLLFYAQFFFNLNWGLTGK